VPQRTGRTAVIDGAPPDGCMLRMDEPRA